jgi:hypothetical protein
MNKHVNIILNVDIIIVDGVMEEKDAVPTREMIMLHVQVILNVSQVFVNM